MAVEQCGKVSVATITPDQGRRNSFFYPPATNQTQSPSGCRGRDTLTSIRDRAIKLRIRADSDIWDKTPS